MAAGSKGLRVYDWAAVRVAVGDAGWPGPERWLLIRRSVSDPTERAYYLSNAPPDTNLESLARVAGARWPIEQCFEEGKGEVGLDHYEVRRYDSWQRHITLALLAHTFLADLRRQAVGGRPAPGAGPRSSAGAPQRARSPATPGSGLAAAGTLPNGAPRLVALAPAPPSHRPTLPLPPSVLRPRSAEVRL